MESLVHLHNYCINEKELDAIDFCSDTYKNLHHNVYCSRQLGGMDQGIVSFDKADRPVSILGPGHHFAGGDLKRTQMRMKCDRGNSNNVIGQRAML